MRDRDLQEAVLTAALRDLGARRCDGVVRAGEGDPVNGDEAQGGARDVDTLPQGEGPHEGGRRIRSETRHQPGHRVLALAQHRGGEPSAQVLRRPLGAAHR